MGATRYDLDRESNENIQRENRESQEKINEQNLGFQRENLDYQKALQQQIFAREDSSYQRTVTDMRKAGLSPLTMQGTNGGGELIATSPLDAGQSYSKQGLFNRGQEQEYKLNLLNSVLSGVSNIMKTNAEIKNINAQTESTLINNAFNDKTFNSRVNAQYLSEVLQNYNMQDSHMKYRYNKYYSIHSGMTEKEKLARILITELGLSNPSLTWDVDKDVPYTEKEGFNNFMFTHPPIYGHEYRKIFDKISEFLNDNKNKKDSPEKSMKKLNGILDGYGSLFGN